MKYEEYHSLYLDEFIKIIKETNIEYSFNESDKYSITTPLFLFVDWDNITAFLQLGKYFKAEKNVYFKYSDGITIKNSIDEFIDTEFFHGTPDVFQDEVLTLYEIYDHKRIHDVIYKPEKKDQYIYFILDVENVAVKIGISSNVKSRLNQLQTGTINTLELLHCYLGDEEEEKRLHRFFSKNHLRGEWFSFGPEISSFIGNLKKPGARWK